MSEALPGGACESLVEGDSHDTSCARQPEGQSRRAFVRSLAALSVAPLTSRLALLGVPLQQVASVASVRRPTRDHVVVVGAGAFGGWAALALLRGGVRVTLLDAWGPGHSRASSGGDTRVIRAVYGGVPVYNEMAVRALTLWREAEQQWGRRVLHRTGALWMCAADDSYVRNSIAPMRSSGLTVEQFSVSDATRRFPQMSFSDVRTVYLEPEAGYIAARAACELVRDTFVQEGGEYRQTWARPGAESGTRLSSVILSDGSRLEADQFVFACGPWLPHVFPDVIGRRIVPTRQEVFFFGTPPGDLRFDTGSLPVWVHLGERTVYGVPRFEGRGLKVADDTAGPEVDPTTMDRAPSAGGVARARSIVRERFPSLGNAPLVEVQVCQYEASRDGNFILDRHPHYGNTWLVGGGSGHGFKMGPAVGEHVASLLHGRAAVHPLFAYNRLSGAGRPDLQFRTGP